MFQALNHLVISNWASENGDVPAEIEEQTFKNQNRTGAAEDGQRLAG